MFWNFDKQSLDASSIIHAINASLVCPLYGDVCINLNILFIFYSFDELDNTKGTRDDEATPKQTNTPDRSFVEVTDDPFSPQKTSLKVRLLLELNELYFFWKIFV